MELFALSLDMGIIYPAVPGLASIPPSQYHHGTKHASDSHRSKDPPPTSLPIWGLTQERHDTRVVPTFSARSNDHDGLHRSACLHRLWRSSDRGVPGDGPSQYAAAECSGEQC